MVFILVTINEAAQDPKVSEESISSIRGKVLQYVYREIGSKTLRLVDRSGLDVDALLGIWARLPTRWRVVVLFVKIRLIYLILL